MRPSLVFSILVISLSSLSAQQATDVPPLPKEPLIQWRAKDFARWIITFNPHSGASQDNAGKQTFSRRVIVTKTQAIIHERIMVHNQQPMEKWCVGELQYSILPGTKRYLPFGRSSFTSGVIDPNLFTDYSKTDFPGFEWVSAKTYSTVKKIMNRDCIVFTEQGEGGKPSATACVDYQTRLPVVLKKGDQTMIYEFSPIPQTLLVLPPEVQSDVDARTPGAKKTRGPH